MRCPIHFVAALRPGTRSNDSYRRVARVVSVSLRARRKKTVLFLLAGSLCSLPCGSTFAADSTTSANQDVSPTSVAATIPDTAAMPSDLAGPEPWNVHGQV